MVLTCLHDQFEVRLVVDWYEASCISSKHEIKSERRGILGVVEAVGTVVGTKVSNVVGVIELIVLFRDLLSRVFTLVQCLQSQCVR